MTPLDERGLGGWRVELGSGEVRHYAGVVVANGHHWAKRYPDYPGEFTGKQLHSKDYGRPSDLKASGCSSSAPELRLRRGGRDGPHPRAVRHLDAPGQLVLPEDDARHSDRGMGQALVTCLGQRRIITLMIRIRFGPWSRYGLPNPDYRPFDKHPIVNEQMLYFLRHGVVRARPGIERLDGRTVHFVDGTAGTYDTIVWGTGFEISFPFLITTYSRGRTACPFESQACSRLASPTSTSSGCFSLGLAPGH